MLIAVYDIFMYWYKHWRKDRSSHFFLAFFFRVLCMVNLLPSLVLSCVDVCVLPASDVPEPRLHLISLPVFPNRAQAFSLRREYRSWPPPPRSSWLCPPTALPTSSSLSAGLYLKLSIFVYSIVLQDGGCLVSSGVFFFLCGGAPGCHAFFAMH